MPLALVLAYLGLGVTGSILGPSLLVLPAQVSAGLDHVGLAVPALFAGLLAGVPLAPLLARRFGVARSAAGAAALQAAALLAVATSPSLMPLLLSAALLGLGFGISEACTAAAVSLAEAGGAGRSLSLLTAAFAGAAVTTPLLVGIALRSLSSLTPAYALGAIVHLSAALALLRLRLPDAQPAAPGRSGWIRLWPLALTLAAYVGAEASIATWAAELSRTLLAVPAHLASAGASAFWLCLVLGRLVGARLLRRYPEPAVLQGTLAVAALTALAAAGAAAAGAGGPVVLALLAAVVAAIGPVYALALSQAMAAVPAGSRAAVTAGAIAVGALGGIAAPLVAAPAAATGPASLLALVAACLAMAAAGAVAHARR